MPSIIYILSNPSMPGLITIGATDNLQQKMRALDKANVPEPFQCFYAGEVENAESTERRLHELFADCRVSSKRNFFRIDPQRVLHALRLANPIDVTPEKNGSALKKMEHRGAVTRNLFVNEAAVLPSPEHTDCPVYIGEERAETSFGMDHNMGVGKQPIGRPVFFLNAQAIKNGRVLAGLADGACESGVLQVLQV